MKRNERQFVNAFYAGAFLTLVLSVVTLRIRNMKNEGIRIYKYLIICAAVCMCMYI